MRSARGNPTPVGVVNRLAATAAAVILVAACQEAGPPPASAIVPASPRPVASVAPSPERGAGGTLSVYYWQAPTIVNPHLSAGTKDLSASRITYEPLASFDADGTLVPFLAAEIPTLENGGVARDGLSVTWKLRPGVLWSDGEPFTADDVRFTFEYASNPDVRSTSAATYAGVERVEVVDTLTVTVHFKDVQPAWAIPFTGVQGMILPRHVFEAWNGPTAQDAPENLKPVGTGPYRVVEFSAEDVIVVGGKAVNTTRIVYEANPYYRDAAKPFFEHVELRGGGGDANFAAELIRDGVADFAWNLVVGEETFAEIEAAGKVVAVSFGAFVERIMLNFTDPRAATADGERSSVQFPHPFLTDKRVRQAISMGVDREAITALYGRAGKLATNLIVSPTSVASPNTTFRYAPDVASTLLDEAGWRDTDGDGIRDKGGQRLELLYQTSINPVRQAAQEIVKNALDPIGVRIELKNIDSSIFLGPPENTTETRRQFYADLEQFAFSNKNPDPQAYLQGWTCGDAAQKANNWSLSNWARYCNPDFDAMFAELRTVIDPDERRELIVRMNDFLVEDAALIPLVHQAEASGLAPDIRGLDVTPWDVEVWNIGDWTRE